VPFIPNEYFNALKKEKRGEITIKLRNDRKIDIFVPFAREVQVKPYESVMGIDINERSVDLLVINEKGARFQSLDSSQISTTHFTYSLKRKNIAKNIDTHEIYQPMKRKILVSKYGKKERDRVKSLVHNLANKVVKIANEHNSLIIVENLTNIRQSNSRQKYLKSWQQKKSKKLRRRLNRWNFKQFQNYVLYKANSMGHLVEYINPKNTSKKCLMCGKCSRCSSLLFVCMHCGFSVNRHFQATANIIENFIKNQNVASSGPAEGRQMKMMVGELRKLKESIVQDASQCDKIIQNYSLLST
jgi:putative transposase